jgi:hypothetical protein
MCIHAAERASSNPQLANFHWSDDRETLTISKLCKNNCPGGREPDMMVIQCNASNQFGYAFGNGYINVFGKLQTLQAYSRRSRVGLVDHVTGYSRA